WSAHPAATAPSSSGSAGASDPSDRGSCRTSLLAGGAATLHTRRLLGRRGGPMGLLDQLRLRVTHGVRARGSVCPLETDGAPLRFAEPLEPVRYEHLDLKRREVQPPNRPFGAGDPPEAGWGPCRGKRSWPSG